MPISFTPITVSNTGQLQGVQTEARTAALSTGGYVVAWHSGSGGAVNVFFQRYDAAGTPIGGATQIVNPASRNMFLRDIEVARDGTFSILTEGSLGPSFADQRLFVSSFFSTSGGASGPQTQLNVTALLPNGLTGAQLVPGSTANSMVVLASGNDAAFNGDLVRAVVTTAGAITAAPVVVNDNYFGTGITEAVESVGAEQFAITSAGGIIDTLGSATVSAGASGDIISFQPGNIVVAYPTFGMPQVSLSLQFGTSGTAVTLQSTGSVIATNLPGGTTAGAQTFATELVDLGGGRILVVWVADGGDFGPGGVVNPLRDGIYAQVYNMNTGGPEDDATLIKGFTIGSNDTFLGLITINAEKMLDGRVALSFSHSNGLSGLDVFHTVLDPRTSGITLQTATARSEMLVGTAFDDTFRDISTGDQILGGAGSDTVIFGTDAARTVDLQNAGAFPANTFSLADIENLTGNANADIFYGNAAGNLLSGLGSNDILWGRDGNDTLLGGLGDDTLRGDNGNDVADGGAGNDIVSGNAGNDTLSGGTEDDLLVGGTGNDHLNGGDGFDRLYGGDGDDALFGDAGDDLISGGEGADQVFGGAGADRIRADSGADAVYAGADNDVIVAFADVELIDGGTGIDTLQAISSFAPLTNGLYIDLTGFSGPLSTTASLTRFGGEITGIENVTGSTGNDYIIGDGVANVLRGGLGDDTLFGGGGADVLRGDAGADVFLLNVATGGADSIRDFAFGTDKIGLEDGAFADINATNIATRLTVNATGTVGASAAAQLIFDNAGAGFGQLLFDADGNGAGAAVLLATLTSPTGTLVALGAADFLIV